MMAVVKLHRHLAMVAAKQLLLEARDSGHRQRVAGSRLLPYPHCCGVVTEEGVGIRRVGAASLVAGQWRYCGDAMAAGSEAVRFLVC